MSEAIRPLRHVPGGFELLDQRQLPDRECWLPIGDPEAAAAAIAAMVVRGAPAIGITAAWGLAVLGDAAADEVRWQAAVTRLLASRPTAVNLGWAVSRMARCRTAAATDLAGSLRREAAAIEAEDLAACRTIGRFAADVLAAGPLTVLTHCNAGALATAGWGTALGVARELHARGRLRAVWATETRPWCQGARLTTWELRRDGLPHVLLTDGAAAGALLGGRIDAVVVGADRIAADGAVANKVGTVGLAVVAARRGIPFLVAAPTSTLDPVAADAAAIPIEQRAGDEVRRHGGTRLVPPETDVWNPAFDVTPPDLIDAIVTERGVARAPFGPSLLALRRDAP